MFELAFLKHKILTLLNLKCQARMSEWIHKTIKKCGVIKSCSTKAVYLIKNTVKIVILRNAYYRIVDCLQKKIIILLNGSVCIKVIIVFNFLISLILISFSNLL